MIEIFGLIGAIFLIVKVVQLRAVLALPLPRLRLAPRTEGCPPELIDLFAELSAQVASLGGSAPFWVDAQRCDGEADAMPIRVVYRAPDGAGLIWAAPPRTPPSSRTVPRCSFCISWRMVAQR